MGTGTAWIITGVILMAAGAGFFAVTHIVITRWIRSYEKLHEQ